jgi:hypothetical protein
MPDYTVRDHTRAIQGGFFEHNITRDILGELNPIEGSVDSTEDNCLKTRCIGLQGTHYVSGNATGVVATGDATVFGRIAKLAGEPKTGLTTIKKKSSASAVLCVPSPLTPEYHYLHVWKYYSDLLLRVCKDR